MKSYSITFSGRRNGAIGVKSMFTKVVDAKDPDQATIKLYDNYEHIHIIRIVEASK